MLFLGWDAFFCWTPAKGRYWKKRIEMITDASAYQKDFAEGSEDRFLKRSFVRIWISHSRDFEFLVTSKINQGWFGRLVLPSSKL